MRRNMDVGRRILGLLLAVCLITSAMPPIQIFAAGESGYDVRLYTAGPETEGREIVGPATYTYNGTPFEPYVEVYDKATSERVPDDAFRVDYDNNTDAGVNGATVYVDGIPGKGYENLDQDVKFTINKAQLDVVKVSCDKNEGPYPYCFYSGDNSHPEILSVTGLRSDNGQNVELRNGVDYQISYHNNTDANVDVSGSGPYFTVKLLKNYEYMYGEQQNRFRIYYDMDKINIQELAPLTYNGKSQTPEFTASNPMKPQASFTRDVDYDVTWDNNKDVGTAKLTLTGKGKYKGTKSTEFVINQADISGVKVTFDQEQKKYDYIGGPLPMESHITVTFNDVPVSRDDYDIDTGTGELGPNTLKLTGKHNFSGTKRETFFVINTIASCELSETSFDYDGTVKVPQITVKDSKGAVVGQDKYNVEYYSDDQYQSKVSGQPTDAGTYYIEIKGKDEYLSGVIGTSEKPVSFVINPRRIDAEGITFSLGGRKVTSADDTTVVYSGQVQSPGEIKVMDGQKKLINETDYSLNFYTDIACDVSHKVTLGDFKNAGTYYIKISGKKNYAGDYILKFTIQPKALDGKSISISIPDQVYTGAEIQLKEDKDITVKILGDRGVEIETLKMNVGYKIVGYEKNIDIGEKTAVVRIQLTGNYSGTQEGYFSIVTRKLQESYIKAGEISNAVYNGLVQMPKIVIHDNDLDRDLVTGEDYTILCYESGHLDNFVYPKDAKEYTVKIKGVGIYQGELSKTYTIDAKPLTDRDITVNITNTAYTGSAITPDIAVTFGNIALEAGMDKDYNIAGYYKDDRGSSPSERISGTVYVKLEGKGNYKGERYEMFRIGEDIGADAVSVTVGSNSVLTYNRKSQYQQIVDSLQVSIMRGGQREVINKKYYDFAFYSSMTSPDKVTDQSNVLFKNAGTIYIKITGKDAYYGEKWGMCTIAPQNISALEGQIEGVDYTYNGKAQTVTSDHISIQHNGEKLKPEDYTISGYVNNTNAGTAKVTVSGTAPNYTGKKELEFTIKQKDLQSTTLKVEIPTVTYTSQKQTPAVKVTDTDTGLALAQGTEFRLGYYKTEAFTGEVTGSQLDEQLTNAGKTYLKIIGNGKNYKGEAQSRDYVYEIQAKDLSDESSILVSLEGQSYKYGTAARMPGYDLPTFTVRYRYSGNSYYTLKMGQDFSFDDLQEGFKVGRQDLNLKAGSGKNFTGSRMVNFYYRGNMDNAAGEITVTGIDASVKYTDQIGRTGATFAGISVQDKAGQPVDPSAYKVTYSNNTTVGTATVKLTGQTSAYWEGTYTQTFKITGDVKESEWQIPDQVYTGKAYTADSIQGLQLTCHGYTLQKDVDYTIESIANGTNAALRTASVHPTITIKGIGDFFSESKGTLQIPFSIKYDINSDDLVADAIPEQVYTGSAITPEITLTYHKADGTTQTLKKNTDYTVAYSKNTEVAEGNGTSGPYVIVTATADGLLMPGSRNIPFTIRRVNLQSDGHFRITGVAATYYYTGEAIRPTVAVEDENGSVLDPKNYTTVCESASWEANTTVTVQVIGRGNYTGTISTSFLILPRSLANSDGQVTATIPDVIYNGENQEPEFRVTFEDYNLDSDGKGRVQTLRQGMDYSIEGYFNNKDAAEGDEYRYESGPYVKIKAIPGTSFTGERIIPFTIQPRDMETLYYSKPQNPVYVTGKTSYEPEVVVKIVAGSGKELTPGDDYRITYYNNTQAAEANGTVGPYIEFEAYSRNFTGTHVIPFAILPKNITGEEFKVTLEDLSGAIFNEKKWNYPEPGTYTPHVTLTDCTDSENPIDLKELTDYQLLYENNDRVGEATITITARGNYTGTRYVKFTIGTLFDETNIAIYQNNSLVTDSFESVVYDGLSHVPLNVTAKRILTPAAELTEDKEYRISYYTDKACARQILPENMINAGTYYVMLSGLTEAGYIGDIVIPFTIEQKSLNAADITVDPIPVQEFGSGNVRPPVTMRDTGTGLVIPTGAYDVTYRDNSAIGTAIAIATANDTGNYTGSREIAFNIVRQDISDRIVDGKVLSVVTVYDIPNQDYTGSMILPDPVVYFGDTRLVKGKDYNLSPDPNYGDNIKAGTAWVVIQGIGNYTGTKATTFKIKANLETAAISALPNQSYTGKPVEPKVRVICGGNQLTQDKEYKVTYSEDHTNPGDAYMVITPTDEYKEWYTGSYLLRFTICDTIEKAVIEGVPTSQTYTGSQITPDPIVKIGSTALKEGRDYSVRWSNNVNVGVATLTVTGIGKYAGSKKSSYQIIAKNIARCTVTPIADISYDNQTHRPAVVIRDGNKVLAQNTDYAVVSYRNNKNVGTASIQVQGLGNYSGTRKVAFDIISAPITGLRGKSTSNSIKLSWSKKSNVTGYEVYTNNVKTRIAQTSKTSVAIRNLKGGKTYRYKVRTYTQISGKTYYGAFKKISVATKPSKPEITVTSIKPKQAVISWKRVTGANGYEIYASSAVKGKYKRVALILKGRKVSYTNKKLTSKKQYYYKVRAYRKVNGKKEYSAYSAPKSVVVK